MNYNLPGTTRYLNVTLLRNLTNAELMRQIDDTTDPLILELALRLSYFIVNYNEEE